MPSENSPKKVSILLAARNEEKNILNCLTALKSLEYPFEKLEICIGDDQSTDNTAELIQKFCKSNPQFKYFKIAPSTTHLQGKTNALAQLAHVAQGEYFFFCDADITVHPQWIQTMLPLFQPETGVVVGITRMKKGNWFANLLSIEWLFILTLVKILSFFKIPITALGNNMAVTRKAYFSTGGYEIMPFSIVEDYALFKNIVQKGYAFAMGYKSTLVSNSEPILDVHELNQQRRRWMKGVKESNILVRVSIVLASSFVPFTCLGLLINTELAFNILLIHYILFTLISSISCVVLKQFDLLKHASFFWFYYSIYYTIMLYLYFSTGKVSWKGRTY